MMDKLFRATCCSFVRSFVRRAFLEVLSRRLRMPLIDPLLLSRGR